MLLMAWLALSFLWKVFWLCVNMLLMAYGAATVIGASSSSMPIKFATVSNVPLQGPILKYSPLVAYIWGLIWLICRCFAIVHLHWSFGSEHNPSISVAKKQWLPSTCSFGRQVNRSLLVSSRWHVNSLAINHVLVMTRSLLALLLQLFYAEYFLIPLVRWQDGSSYHLLRLWGLKHVSMWSVVLFVPWYIYTWWTMLMLLLCHNVTRKIQEKAYYNLSIKLVSWPIDIIIVT